jgi:large subunit ribosomal protein L18
MSNQLRNLQMSRARRVHRVRARVIGTAERPRLAVSRTLQHISAQIIDDAQSRTIVAASDRDVSAATKKGKKPVEIATEVGKLLAERAAEKKVTKVVFDRRDKRFHGRVKALAEGAREGGLKF